MEIKKSVIAKKYQVNVNIITAIDFVSNLKKRRTMIFVETFSSWRA